MLVGITILPTVYIKVESLYEPSLYEQSLYEQSLEQSLYEKIKEE